MYLFIYSALIFYCAGFLVVILYHKTQKELFESVSKAALVMGLVVHAVALFQRTYVSGHAPMMALYETLLFYSWITMLISIIVIFRYRERFTELITVPIALLALVFAQMKTTPPRQLPLILNTRWFETHVIASFAAYAFFTLAFAGAVLYLFSEFRSASNGQNSELKKAFQDIANRSVLWGLFLFSASMFAGAVWAYLAWGTYWLWEPKIIWSFIVWFYYSAALHAYYVREWRGKGLAIATAGGFFVVLFTYLGVSLLMKSSHSF